MTSPTSFCISAALRVFCLAPAVSLSSEALGSSRDAACLKDPDAVKNYLSLTDDFEGLRVQHHESTGVLGSDLIADSLFRQR